MYMDKLEFSNKFNEALRSNESIVFFCSCEVEYSGRAEAELPIGDRIVIVKSDNTLLIHQPVDNNPINYMKKGSSIRLVDEDDSLRIKTYNADYKDYLDIIIYDVYNFISRKLYDGKELILAGNEQDMSDMIKEKPELIASDFQPLSREEHTKYGFIDVFGHDNKGNLVIIECKRYSAGLSAVQQLRRYVEKMSELKGIEPGRIRGVLAAPDITKNAKEMLTNWDFSFVSVEAPKRLEKYRKNQKSILDY